MRRKAYGTLQNILKTHRSLGPTIGLMRAFSSFELIFSVGKVELTIRDIVENANCNIPLSAHGVLSTYELGVSGSGIVALCSQSNA